MCMTNKEGKASHCLTLDNRKALAITGVAEVDSYDDKIINVYTDLGELKIKGEDLNIKKLDLEVGDLEIVGKINSLSYNDDTSRGMSFLSKIWK